MKERDLISSDELIIDSDDINEIDLVEEEVDDSVYSLPIPRLELIGMTSEEEIMFIKSIVEECPSDSSLPLYIVYGLDKILSGYLDLKLSNILELRFIGSNKYILSLTSDDGVIDILSPNLGDTEINRLINFIRVRG